MSPATVGDRLDVIETMSTFAWAIDSRDWAAYRAVFTDEIDLDYSSYRPENIGRVTADWWVARARRLFPGLDATSHSISNHVVRVDGDVATCDCYVRADHVLNDAPGGSVWTIGGVYRDRLVRTGAGWKITGKRLVVRWAEGNRSVMDLALERATPPAS